jgi:putative transcriptional regulator
MLMVPRSKRSCQRTVGGGTGRTFNRIGCPSYRRKRRTVAGNSLVLSQRSVSCHTSSVNTNLRLRPHRGARDTMSKSLAPGLLIASPPLGDPNFDRTVVLLALHNEDGALGFVVNRAAPLTLGELLEHAGYEPHHEDPTQVWFGGPVQPQSAWVLLDDPSIEPGDSVIEVGSRLRVSSSRAHFDRLAADSAARPEGTADAARRMVMLGYSGWAPEQLEGEIARGAWLPVDLAARAHSGRRDVDEGHRASVTD